MLGVVTESARRYAIFYSCGVGRSGLLLFRDYNAVEPSVRVFYQVGFPTFG